MSDNSNLEAASVRKPRWKYWLQNLLLMFGTFLICGVLLELVLRVAGYGNLEIYQPDPVLYWRLKPNQDCFTKVDHKPVHINSHGTRGADFTDAKPAGTLRILSLGDSRTFGWGLTDEETYSRRLERAVAAANGDGKVEVINAGVNAWSYPQQLVYFRDIGMKYQPDVVIVGSANLWTQFSEQNSPEFVGQFLKRVWLKNFLRRFATYHFFIEVQLQAVYERYRVKFIPVDPKQDELFKAQQKSDPDAVFREAITGICELAQSNGVKPILLYLPVWGAPVTNNIQQVMAGVAERTGTPFVDVTAAVVPGGNGLYLDADPVHFNAPGNEIIAASLFQSLTNLITK